MQGSSNNIFDLSALPPANSGFESQPTKRSGDSSNEQFESVLNGAISDGTPGGTPTNTDSPAKLEQPAKQETAKQADQRTIKKEPVSDNQINEKPANKKQVSEKLADEKQVNRDSALEKPAKQVDHQITKEKLASAKPSKRNSTIEIPIKKLNKSVAIPQIKGKEAKVVLTAKTQEVVLSKAGEQKSNEMVRRLAGTKVSDLISPKTKIKHGSINSEPVIKSQLVKPTGLEDENRRTTESLDKFSVEKVTVRGNEVEVIARSAKDESKTVKMVVPKEQFEMMVSPQKKVAEAVVVTSNNRIERVPLDGLVETTPKLDQLLQKLNLQEILVKNDITKASKDGLERPLTREATVKLVGAESTAELLVKGQIQVIKDKSRTISRKRLAPKGINLTTPRNRKANLANQNPATAGDGRVSLVNTRTADGGLILKEVKVRSEVFNLAEQFANNPTTNEAGSDKNFSSVMLTESNQTGSTSALRNEPTPVRFSLPDDLGQSLKPGGKAVTIKIHPEILGPVRLTLRMNGSQLQARLIVDSAQVKSMIEGTLEQLTDQLERAGIKVNSMDVNVAGSDVGSELFDRSLAWNRPKLTTRLLDAEEAELLSLATTEPSRSSGEYVGSSGVNLFA